MNRYMIYCCTGSGGLFLTSVVAQILGYNVYSNFSSTGHAHDMGSGNWKGAKAVCFVGCHWELNFLTGYDLYYSHVIPAGFCEKNPEFKLIKIVVDPIDYEKVAELLVYKAWPDLWTKEEYDKWASKNYPPYSRNNINESELIRKDLITDLKITNIKHWHEENLNIPNYATINFRTVMGIDQLDLVDTVCNILKLSATDTTRQYVSNYQRINQTLYFKNYV